MRVACLLLASHLPVLVGQGHLLAHEESKAIAVDKANLCGFDVADVRYEGRSSGVVSDRVNAACFDAASLQADGHVVVGYVTHREDVHPSIVVRSESVEVCPLTHGASLTRFAKLLDGVRDTSKRPKRLGLWRVRLNADEIKKQ